MAGKVVGGADGQCIVEVGCGGGEGVDAKEPTELGFDPIWLGKGTKEG